MKEGIEDIELICIDCCNPIPRKRFKLSERLASHDGSACAPSERAGTGARSS